MTSKLFDKVKSGVHEEYAARKYKAAFTEFLEQLERNPYKYTRTAFQMVSDMIEHFGTRDIEDCGDKITRYKIIR